MEKKGKLKLLAISGGVDSMFLLQKYYKKNVIVAHVNYGIRKQAAQEEALVRSFCEKHKIPFFVKKIQWTQNNTKNFQNWARKTRYDFFYSLYYQYQCNELLVAHHRDDLIETYYWQKKSQRKPLIYGMLKNSVLMTMTLKRPFLYLYSKKMILKKIKLPYLNDASNFEEKYTRNRNRKELKKHKILKKVLFFEIVFKNMVFYFRKQIILKQYKSWAKSLFSYQKIVTKKFFPYLITKFLQEHIYLNTNKNLKLSSKKIDIIRKFLSAQKNKNKQLLIRKDVKIIKNHNKILLIYIL